MKWASLDLSPRTRPVQQPLQWAGSNRSCTVQALMEIWIAVQVAQAALVAMHRLPQLGLTLEQCNFS